MRCENDFACRDKRHTVLNMAQAIPLIRPRAGRLSKADDTCTTHKEAWLASGYADICMRWDQICAVKQFNFTTAVVVGLDPIGYLPLQLVRS